MSVVESINSWVHKCVSSCPHAAMNPIWYIPILEHPSSCMHYNLVESYVGGKPVVSEIVYHYPLQNCGGKW
jgi:hypothetical protein